MCSVYSVVKIRVNLFSPENRGEFLAGPVATPAARKATIRSSIRKARRFLAPPGGAWIRIARPFTDGSGAGVVIISRVPRVWSVSRPPFDRGPADPSPLKRAPRDRRPLTRRVSAGLPASKTVETGSLRCGPFWQDVMLIRDHSRAHSCHSWTCFWFRPKAALGSSVVCFGRGFIVRDPGCVFSASGPPRAPLNG